MGGGGGRVRGRGSKKGIKQVRLEQRKRRFTLFVGFFYFWLFTLSRLSIQFNDTFFIFLLYIQ